MSNVAKTAHTRFDLFAILFNLLLHCMIREEVTGLLHHITPYSCAINHLAFWSIDKLTVLGADEY